MKFKNVKGIEGLLFGLVLVLLPINLAKHVVFYFCYVDGILVDYLIPTIYLTDILIWGLLLSWLFRFLRCKQYSGTYRGTIGTSKVFVALGLGIITVAGLSVFNVQNQPAAVYKWLKLVEYILFAFYVSKHIDLKKDFFTIVKLMSVGVLFESVLVIAQWFKQGSILGYWFFGENRFTVSTSGIATFDLFGVKKVRPYGTFPHPNVLGGYLSIVLPWVLHNLSSKFNPEAEQARYGARVQNSKFSLSSVFYLLSFALGLSALCITFSRSAWFVGAFGLFLTFGLFRKRSPLSTFNFSRFEESPLADLLIFNSLSFLRRAELNWIALEMIKNHPLLGVGLNNFTVVMGQYGKVSGWTRFLQPAHNVYLLVASEIGLIGLVMFLCLLFSAFRLLLKKKNYLLLISLTQVALLCFVDHYFFTLQQTSLLFWLLVGLVFSSAAVVVVRNSI